MKLPIVEVTWEDASSSQPWSDDHLPLEPFLCVTVGIQVKRDKQAIHLVTTMGDGVGWAGQWRIPAGMIRKVRVVGKLAVEAA